MDKVSIFHCRQIAHSGKYVPMSIIVQVMANVEYIINQKYVVCDDIINVLF